MTRAEQRKMERLEHENAQLKDKLDAHFKVYRDQLYELVALRVAMTEIQESIEYAMLGGDDDKTA